MTWNENRSYIGSMPVPDEDGNWYVTSNQIDKVTEARGQVMLDAVENQKKGLTQGSLNRKQMSNIGRKAAGKVYVDGVEYKTNDVGKSLESGVFPTISEKVHKSKTARGARTEKADYAVQYWAYKLNRQNAWPKGKSLEGYEKWLRTNYETLGAKDAADFTKKYKYQVDIGHAAQGPNAKSMLSPQLRWGQDANRTTNQWYIVEEGDTLTSIANKEHVSALGIEELGEKTKGIGKRGINQLKEGKLKAGTRIKLSQITSNLDHVRDAADLEAADIATTHARAFEEYLFEGKNEYLSTKIVDGKEVDVMRSVNTMEGWTPEELQAIHHRDDFAGSAESAQTKVREGRLKIANNKALRKAAMKASKATSKLSTTDAVGRLTLAAATGDLVGGTFAGGQIAMQKMLSNPAAQKRILSNVKTMGNILSKRFGKIGLKMVPGLDVGLSAMETSNYLAEGKLDQAQIAALSGAIGWIPIIGDIGSAALDLTNTAFDIARADYNKKPEVMALDKKTISKAEVKPKAQGILKQFKEGASDALRITKGL